MSDSLVATILINVCESTGVISDLKFNYVPCPVGSTSRGTLILGANEKVTVMTARYATNWSNSNKLYELDFTTNLGRYVTIVSSGFNSWDNRGWPWNSYDTY